MQPLRYQRNADWERKVKSVFVKAPRMGVADPLWMPRTDDEDRLATALCSGSPVCLDGPSGAGKTSLMYTVLEASTKTDSPLNFLYRRVAKGSTWETLKRDLLQTATHNGTSLKLGISSLLPYVEVSTTGREHGVSANPQDAVDDFGFAQIADILMKKDLLLIIDDVDLASPELISNLCDLAKQLTDTNFQQRGQVAFVGSGAIYRGFVDTMPQLRNRISHVSIGTLTENWQGWDFFCKGLVRLGIRNPSEDMHITPLQLQECKAAFHRATDGLPKSIVDLSQEIATNARMRKRLSYREIFRVSTECFESQLAEYEKMHREFAVLLKTSSAARKILELMYAGGIGRVYDFKTLANAWPDDETVENSLENTLDKLKEMKFLVLTGMGNQRIFVNDPLLAHTFASAVKMGRYIVPGWEQLVLPFED